MNDLKIKIYKHGRTTTKPYSDLIKAETFRKLKNES